MASSSKKQILQIIELQTSALSSKDTNKLALPINNPLVFLLQTKIPHPVTSVEEMIQPYLEGVKFSVGTLRGAESMPYFFIVTVPYVSFFDLSGSPFELVYRLESHPDIISAEADLETPFYSWKSPSEEKLSQSAKRFCFSSKTTDPNPHDQGWALRQIRVDKASANYQRTGAGIKLAQIDTGLSEHVEFDGLVINESLGLSIYEDEKGAIDPLEDGFLENPGHGTAVASIVISQGGVTADQTTDPGKITGVAQGVDYFPIRAMRSVMHLRQSKITKAVHAAIDASAHIISMSLGGMPSHALKTALRRAEQANLIPLAASGNCVPVVVFPAAYASCLAVSGTRYDKTPWRGASTGSQVDISAPAEFVPHADRSSEKDPQPYIRINRGQGTSFAVALTAGVAALWLEHFGRDALIESLVNGETLLQRFRACVKLSAQTPVDWPVEKMGAGIVDANKLLSFDPFDSDLIKLNKPGTKGFSFSDYFSMPSYDAALEYFGAEIFYQLMCRDPGLEAYSDTEKVFSGAVPLSKELSQHCSERPEFNELVKSIFPNTAHLKVE